MKLYLQPMGDNIQYSDHADYGNATAENPPFTAPIGMEWVQGDPAVGATFYAIPTLSDKLNATFLQLTDEQQADFSALKAAVKLELDQGRNNIAKLVIERATIPAELESVRQQMLSEFAN